MSEKAKNDSSVMFANIMDVAAQTTILEQGSVTLYQKSSGNIVSIDPRSLLDVDIKQEIDDLSEEPEEQLLQVSDEASVNQAVQKQFEDELYNISSGGPDDINSNDSNSMSFVKVLSPKNPNKRKISSPKIVSHSKKRNRQLPCLLMECEFIAQSSRDLERHMTSHSGAKPFTCKHCSKSFSRLTNVRRHEASHSDVKKYACRFCPKRFGRQDCAARHEELHTGAQRFACSFCGKGFFQHSNLKRHETLNHAIDKPHECNLCPYTKKFQLSSSLKRHMKMFHGQDNDVDYSTQEKERILMLPNPEISIHE